MITKKFLDTLKGKTVKQAETACKKAGHKSFTVNYGHAVAMIVYPNTVILWKDESGKRIRRASNGEG